MPLSSGTIKFISSLRQKKVRQSNHKFTAEGPRIVGECLEQQRYRVDHVFALAAYLESTPIADRIPRTVVTEKELSRISQLKTANQVLAVLDQPEPSDQLPTGMKNGWSLYLDGVQSPSNLGAILRIADWFGFGHVIGGPGTADLYNSKTVQATMGSFLRVDYREGKLEDIVTQFPDLHRFVADMSGQSIYELNPPGQGLLIMGSEGPGVSDLARTQGQTTVKVPAVDGAGAESLNVAVAAGILCGGLRYGTFAP